MAQSGVDDPFALQRFVEAQDHAGVYAGAVSELTDGRKQSHWMWFVFPQLSGLGRSPTARRFGLSGIAEARAYLAHPVLGRRLTTCATILCGLTGHTAVEIFGPIDAQKLHSSMTLFHQVEPGDPVFGRVLRQYFAGDLDPATTGLL